MCIRDRLLTAIDFIKYDEIVITAIGNSNSLSVPRIGLMNRLKKKKLDTTYCFSIEQEISVATLRWNACYHTVRHDDVMSTHLQ